MSLTEFALKRNRLTLVVVAVIVLGGGAAYRSLPRSEDPEFTIRTALVSTFFPGASPERVEQLVTDKIEQKIQEIPELDYVASESRTGVSLIYVNIKEQYADMRPLWSKLRDKVEDARPSLRTPQIPSARRGTGSAWPRAGTDCRAAERRADRATQVFEQKQAE